MYKTVSVFRISFSGRFGHVIVIPKDGDKNMLRRVIWDELRMLDEIIKNATATYDGQTFTYSQICAHWLDECFNNDILNLDQVIELVSSPHCSFLKYRPPLLMRTD